MVSCSDDHTLCLWLPCSSKKPVARMTGHMQPVNHVAFRCGCGRGGGVECVCVCECACACVCMRVYACSCVYVPRMRVRPFMPSAAKPHHPQPRWQHDCQRILR